MKLYQSQRAASKAITNFRHFPGYCLVTETVKNIFTRMWQYKKLIKKIDWYTTCIWYENYMKNYTGIFLNWMPRKYKRERKCGKTERRVMVQKPRGIMISSLYEERIGTIALSLVTAHKCDVRNSESSLPGSIEGKKEAKAPVSHAAPCSVSRRRDACAGRAIYSHNI